MARLIAAVGNVSYGGITFPSALHAKIQSKTNYQVGEVGVKSVTHTINVDTILTYTDPPISNAATADAAVDSAFSTYREILLSRGKTLTFTEQGWGSVVVKSSPDNSAAVAGARTYYDLDFGPKPRLLVWEAAGSNRAVHCSWQCEFTIAECASTAITGQEGILEVTHESSWTKNSEGLLTRTVRATIEVAANFGPDGVLTNSADKYTEQFMPATVEGFHREVFRKVSPNHRVLSITYIDTEISSDNAYYNGMVNMSVSHTVSSQLENEGFTRWTNVIDGSIRWAAGVPAAVAWASAADIMRQRFSQKGTAPVYSSDTQNKEVKVANIPMALSITEQLFDRELNFSFIYAGVVNLNKMVEYFGLFKPLTGISWKNWHNSILPVQHPLGPRKLREKNTDVSLTQICSTNSPLTPNNEIKKPLYQFAQSLFPFGCGYIPKEASWLVPGNYRVKVEEVTGGGFIFDSAGPAKEVGLAKDTSASPSTVGSEGVTTKEGTPASYAPQYQNRTYNEYKIRITAKVVRVCYEPYSPTFTHYGDVPLHLYYTGDEIKKVSGQFFPTYYQTIDRVYTLSRIPPGSPLLKIKTDANKGDR